MNAANFYGTMLFCYTILRLKLNVPRDHIGDALHDLVPFVQFKKRNASHLRQKNLYSPWYPKVFHGSSLTIASKT